MKCASLVFATVTLLVPVGLKAQQGDNGVGGGGYRGGVYPGSAPAVVRPATPNLGGRPYPIRTDIPAPTGLNPPAAAYTGISPGAFKPQNNFGGRNGRGFVGGGPLIGAPVIGGPLYYPYLGYESPMNTFPSYTDTVDPNAQAFAVMQESLGEQIRQLSAELDSVKRQVSTPPAPLITPMPPQPTPAMAPSQGEPSSASQPPIAVVLKDGQRLSVQSYAVMNGNLWDFSKQPVRKIPISTIDVGESVKASEANGTEFPDLSSASRVTVSH